MIGARKHKISILFLVDQIERSTAGSEQHISFLLKHLPRDRYRVLLALLRRAPDWDEAEFPIQPMCLELRSFYRPHEVIQAALNLTRLIKSEHIDIIQAFFPDSELLGVIAKALNKSVGLVSVRRNMGYWHTPFSLLRARLVSRGVRHFIANCEAVKKQVGQTESIPMEKVAVIYNPINRARITDGLADNISRSGLGIKNGVPIIGMVANIRPIKDYECFLKASRIIADKEPNAKFVIIGSGEEGTVDRLRKRISELDLANCVMNLGERRNPMALLRLFDVGVLTSRSEGLSNTLLEYGALGVPSVASAVGGNAEIIKEGVTGFLVPPASPETFAERVLKLVRNEGLRKSQASEARKYVLKKFDGSSIISAYDKYYRKIFNDMKENQRGRGSW